MAGLNDEGQWIILMGFIISIGIFFLAILVNQSVLVGQTTAESVLEFPKSDIQDLRNEIRIIKYRYDGDPGSISGAIEDITVISLSNKAAVVNITPPGVNPHWKIHYNNGVTSYDEEIQYWDF
jgi:hypothetical protein